MEAQFLEILFHNQIEHRVSICSEVVRIMPLGTQRRMLVPLKRSTPITNLIQLVDRQNNLNAPNPFALTSSHPILYRLNAMSKIDPHNLLQQLDAPHRPNWQTILTGWVSVKVPLPLFKEWDGKYHDWGHLYYEYNAITERMLINVCLPISMNACQAHFFSKCITRHST